MATVLCFGDSNTWGTAPGSRYRYAEHERWPALLKSALISVAEVIEEGQQGRTLVHNNPFQGVKSGQRYLKDCLDKYTPDIVLILLGTNDLKKRFSLSADDVAQSAGCLVEQTQQFKSSLFQKRVKLLLIAPPPVYEVGFYAKMYSGAAAKSMQLAKCYALCAQHIGCAFFDAGSVVSSCAEEGIHWRADQHQFLADALVPIIKDMLDELS